jgi:hypothetical protein
MPNLDTPAPGGPSTLELTSDHSRNIGFKTQYVEARGSGAKYFALAMLEITAMALAAEGLRAFDSPKSSAALHEAGHCVIDALDGDIPQRASIWRIVEFGRPQWIGRTEGAPRWRVDETTDAAADLKQARSQLAGVIAEILFDSDYRLGSSIDEILTSQSIAATAAVKLHCDPMELWWATCVEVQSRLTTNACAVHAIARVLSLKGNISARSLSRLLQTLESGR